MLAISPLKSCNGDEREGETFLDDINFDDIFLGFNDGDILPDLEIDPADIYADFSFSGGEESGNTPKLNYSAGEEQEKLFLESTENTKEEKEFSQCEVVSAKTKKVGSVSLSTTVSSAAPETGRLRKSFTTLGKGSHGKKKAKVDWTPELHRRFVQAVEQLGVDKAVPSRILEIMGIDCLTRHNIASHLQKYRSHRKHLLAREAEAASWSQRRQAYAGSGVTKRDMNPNWAAPTIIGFPPSIQPFRPLHVWGHPSPESSPQLVPVWPGRHLSQPPWVPPRPLLPPAPDPSYWHHHYQRVLTQGGPPFFPPQLLPPTKFPAPPIQANPPHPLYKRPPQNAVSAPKQSTLQQPQLDANPSNESIDAAIGDVLAKPWLPLPLGLKPPSLESVMGELQRQGVSNVPPICG